MTGHQANHFLGKERELRAPRITVVASPEEIEKLERTEGTGWLHDAELVALGVADPIPSQIVDRAEVILIEVDPEEERSMRRIEQVKARKPGLPQIVALSNANVSVVRTVLRQGVCDVVAKPLDPAEILQASLRLVEASEDSAAETGLAPMIAVVRSLGGCGTTTLVTHLAHALQTQSHDHAEVCVIDLDVQFGSIADSLSLVPRRDLSDLIEAGNRLDGQFLRSVALQHESGISVIPAPREIQPLETVDTEQLLEILEVARREYSFVLVDLPSNWSSWNLSALIEANQIILLVEQSLASLRQAKRRLDLFRSVGIPGDKTSIVVNRVEKRLFGAISLSDVEQTLGHDIVGSLREDGKALSEARDHGMLVSRLKPKSPYVADVAKLADLLVSRISRTKSA